MPRLVKVKEKDDLDHNSDGWKIQTTWNWCPGEGFPSCITCRRSRWGVLGLERTVLEGTHSLRALRMSLDLSPKILPPQHHHTGDEASRM